MSHDHPDLARLAAARPSRPARVIAAATNPALVIGAITSWVALRSAGSPVAGLAWAASAAVFCVILPYGVLLILLRGGIVADRHVVRREQRLWPSIAALISELLGLGLLGWWGAPRLLLVLMAAQLAGLLAISMITLVTKASLHTATTAGALCLGAVLEGGLWWVAAAVLTPLVAWARWRGGRHSLAQVSVGAVIGGLTIATIFWTLSLGPLSDVPLGRTR